MLMLLHRQCRLLLVDDDSLFTDVVSHLLSTIDLRVVTARNGEEAMNLIAREDFDLVITDTNMEPINGVELLKSIKRTRPTLPVVIFFGGLATDPNLSTDAVARIGATYVIEKTSESLHKLEDMVRSILVERTLGQ